MTKFGTTPIKAFNKITSKVNSTTSHVESNPWVKLFDYDEDKQVLTITFRDGFVAHYPNITKDEATAFAEAESKGSFVREHLYNHKYY